jgi:hypothetical protein
LYFPQLRNWPLIIFGTTPPSMGTGSSRSLYERNRGDLLHPCLWCQAWQACRCAYRIFKIPERSACDLLPQPQRPTRNHPYPSSKARREPQFTGLGGSIALPPKPKDTALILTLLQFRPRCSRPDLFWNSVIQQLRLDEFGSNTLTEGIGRFRQH